MAIDTKDLVSKMTQAASAVLKSKWPITKAYAEMEFRKLGETIVSIEEAKLKGEIDEEDARILIDMQKNAMRTVLLAVEGLGALAAEQAINAALSVIRDTVNRVVGFALL